MRNNTTQREQSTVSSDARRATNLNRRAIVLALTIAAAVLAIILPSSSLSSAVRPSPHRADIDRQASATRQSAERLQKDSSGVAPLINIKAALGLTAADTLFVPEPLQSGGTQVIVNFDDVPPFTNVENRYPHVKFSSPLRTIEARDYWAPPTSHPNKIGRAHV